MALRVKLLIALALVATACTASTTDDDVPQTAAATTTFTLTDAEVVWCALPEGRASTWLTGNSLGLLLATVESGANPDDAQQVDLSEMAVAMLVEIRKAESAGIVGFTQPQMDAVNDELDGIFMMKEDEDRWCKAAYASR